VRLRRLYLLLLSGLAGVTLAMLPAIAGSETTPSIQAENVAGLYGERHYWTPEHVTVAAGGSLVISNPTNVSHGVEWIAAGTPPVCTGTVPVGNAPSASGTQWTGTCTFPKAGIYTFYCTVHGSAMKATVVVESAATTPTGTSTGTTGTPSTPAPAPGSEGAPPAASSPSAGESVVASSERLTAVRGRGIRGSVVVSRNGAGGQLEVDLLAARASLASRSRDALVRVGRIVRSRVPAGLARFSVPLDGAGRHALRSHGTLRITVRLRYTPPHGSVATIAKRLLLRR
jgi:plastocyanin